MELLREDGLDQAEALIQINLGLSQTQVDNLSDEEFINLASLAYFMEDRKTIAIKRGIMIAVSEIF